MTTFPSYATNFELHPKDGEAAQHLAQLVNGLGLIDFAFRVDDPTKNQGQLESDFDAKLESVLLSRGARPYNLALPAGVPQELDFAFSFGDHNVAVEIEKANQDKILRDIPKSHIYLHAGAHFAIVVLPRNYAHKHGVWNLFEFGIERYDECRTYGFGSPDKLGRIALLGFDQHEAATSQLLTKANRKRWRVETTASLKAT
jgi:hypothetical protein